MTDSGAGRHESVPRRPRPAEPAQATGGASEPVRTWQLPDTRPDDPASWEARIRGIRAALERYVPEATAAAEAEREQAELERQRAHGEAAATADAARGDIGTAVDEALGAHSRTKESFNFSRS